MLVSDSEFITWLQQSHAELTVPSFMPSAQVGCCDGSAGCCRRSMRASITWLEAEAIWGEVKAWPIERRKSVALLAKSTVDEVSKKIDLTESTLNVAQLKQRESAMGAVSNPSCPLLVAVNVGGKPTWGCSVYGVRPLICAGFGGSCKMVVSGQDDAGKPIIDPVFLGCDTAFDAAKENLENQWVNYGFLENQMYDRVSPKIRAGDKVVARPPIIMKPIPFWLADLTDENGDLTNPRDIFSSIRASLESLLEDAKSNIPSEK